MKPQISTIAILGVLAAPWQGCANENGPSNAELCSGITCSGHGICAVTSAGDPMCGCDTGYYAEGFSCIEDGSTGPCFEVDCSGHGTCANVDGQPECLCNEGYQAVGLECLGSETCAGVSCSGHGICEVIDEAATCTCDAGYHTDGLACVELIETPMDITLSAGENYTFDAKHMKDIADIGLQIFGIEGSGNVVTIKNSKFTNIKLPLRLYYIDTVIVEGNWFEDVWSCMHIAICKNVIVRYNKSRRHGVLPERSSTSWAGNFAHFNSCDMDSFNVHHNLIDRSSDTRENTQENTFAEDHISVYHTKMNPGKTGYITDNYIMGSEEHCESGSGGGITMDQFVSGINIERNTIYNTGSFLIGIASSTDIELHDNLGFMTQAHDSYIQTNAHHEGSDNSGPSKNCQLVITNYTSGDSNDVENIFVTGNRMLAVRQDSTSSVQWLDVDLAELTFTNNSFIKHLFDGTGGDLSEPTQQEVYEAIVGADEAGMFATHGQGAEYFQGN